MSTRSRHEARWTHETSTVTGRKNKNRAWVLLVLAAVVIGLATLGYVRFMGFAPVSYELRECAEPLTEEASWAQVQAAACDPAADVGATVTLMRGSEAVAPDTVEDATLTWESWPVNSPEHAIEVDLDEPAQSVVIAEPDTERLRTALSPDASDTRWGGFIGGRGPTTYWVLITPR